MIETKIKPDGEGRKGCYDLIRYHVPFTFEDIDKAYCGEPNHCMCGCAGTYYDTKDEPKKVRSIFNKMIKNADKGIQVIKEYIYTIELGKTQYTIFLDERRFKKAIV